MKMKKALALLAAGAMTVASLAGCGGSGSSSTAPAASTAASTAEAAASTAEAAPAAEGVSKVKLWATGSDNVRAIFETLTEDFNKNSEYAGKYEVELNFMLSGTGAASLTDGVAAAFKAGQTDSEYDIVDLSGDDLSKLVSQIGEDAFVKLDASKIPNAASVSAKSSIAADYCQPYRGTTVASITTLRVPAAPATPSPVPPSITSCRKRRSLLTIPSGKSSGTRASSS